MPLSISTPTSVVTLVLCILIGIPLLLLLLIGLILLLRVKLILLYDDGGPRLDIRLLFYNYRLYPDEPSKGPHSMSRRRARQILENKKRKRAFLKWLRDLFRSELTEEQLARTQTGKKKKGGHSVSLLLDDLSLVLKLIKRLIGRFGHHLRVDLSCLKLTVATSDAAATAVAYGAVCGVINTLIPILQDLKGVSLPDADRLEVRADFLSDELKADVKITLSLRLWQIADILIRAVFAYLEHKDGDLSLLLPQKSKKKQSLS